MAAAKATIYKAQLAVADMDRGHYADYALTLARHPSETDERMMLRLVAFALHADELLAFGKGLSDPDEPDLWRRDLTGLIEEWIVLGQPDERNLIKACGRARQVTVYNYGHAAGQWWAGAEARLERARNLQVRRLSVSGDTPVTALAARTMDLNCSIQEQQIWIGNGELTIAVDCTELNPKMG
ncbi:MAG: YaeQ protein [Hydrocarboniphaga sp.]|uniref:YaeQ family protein n=1 Tax=Hydrocarboniphaga sp. TaxID=2033016 RepID=UPI00260CE0AB|nr:YaeQ family protein [Hydrocarboniphaga sp.]MDB5968451.1 YaeQ protein [Hydrocarboniphaga sp.]